MKLYINASSIINSARTKAKLSQNALAQISGVAQSSISRYERGIDEPTFFTTNSLIESCGLTLRDVLDDIDRRNY